MELKPTFYLVAILIFSILTAFQLFFGFKLSIVIFINLLLIYLIFINFYAPFWFSFIIALISGLIFDIFYLNLWGVSFFLFLILIVLEKFLLKIFEQKSTFTWLIIGEFLILVYFIGIFLAFLIFKQPIFYLNLLLSLLANIFIYWLFINIIVKKLFKVS